MKMRFAAVATAATAILLLGACGDDDDSSDATADTGGSTEQTADGGGGSEDSCAAPSESDFGPTTVIAEQAFDPDTVTVAAGDVFSVGNDDGTTHTVTSDEGGFDCELAGGESASILIDAAPGDYEFHCKIHPSMTGIITVQ